MKIASRFTFDIKFLNSYLKWLCFMQAGLKLYLQLSCHYDNSHNSNTYVPSLLKLFPHSRLSQAKETFKPRLPREHTNVCGSEFPDGIFPRPQSEITRSLEKRARREALNYSVVSYTIGDF